MRLCVLLLALSVCVTLQVRAQEDEEEDEDVHVEDNLGDEDLLDGDGELDLEPEEDKPTPTPAAPTVRPTTSSLTHHSSSAANEELFLSIAPLKPLNSSHRRFPLEILETLFGFNSSPSTPQLSNHLLWDTD